MSMPSFNARARSLQRLLVGYAEDVEIDSAGRILLSLPLREFAGLEKHVMLVGQGAKFELWDEARWLADRETGLMLQADGELPPEMEGFSL